MMYDISIVEKKPPSEMMDSGLFFRIVDIDKSMNHLIGKLCVTVQVSSEMIQLVGLDSFNRLMDQRFSKNIPIDGFIAAVKADTISSMVIERVELDSVTLKLK